MAEASSTTPARVAPPSRASERQVWKSTACHTDSAEEILYIVAGEGEARLGDERGPVQAGDLAVIPAMVPHGIANTGDEPLKVVGFFCESEIVSTFAEPLQPMGLATLTQGEPVAA